MKEGAGSLDAMATPAPTPAPAPHLAETELRVLTDIAAGLAHTVGGVVRSLRETGVDVAATKSSINDVVTAADREAERLITEGLRELRPDDGILGEEGASIVGTTGITWVVDPIDGTVNYLYGLPAYGVSIAATLVADTAETGGAVQTGQVAPGAMADGRKAIAGAVYLPVTDELFTAFEGGGATLNGVPLSGPAETDLSTALVATGFGYTVERRTEQAEVVRQLIPRVRDIRRMGSAATDLCLLAAGRLDAYYERGLQPWDYAAAALIAREAGALLLGRSSDAGQLPPGEPLLIAAAPALARTLQAEIAQAYAAIEPD